MRRCCTLLARIVQPISSGICRRAELLPKCVLSIARSLCRSHPLFKEALGAGMAAGVIHFPRRAADSYVKGAKMAGIVAPALAVRHLCLSSQVAEPLADASRVDIASHPDEAALIELLQAPTA